MTAFNFTSGNPADLTAGADAEMVDVQGPFNDLKAFLNAGTLDETNVPNLAAAYTTWKTIAWGGGVVNTQGVGATVLCSGGPGAEAAHQVINVSAAGGASWVFYLNPADWLANARTTKMRLRAQYLGNAVAPGTSFQPGVYPVTAVGGASGTAPAITTTGTVVTGSNPIFTTPGASAMLQTTSTEFNAPTAGFYCFAITVGGGMAAGSQCTIGIQLQMRQI